MRNGARDSRQVRTGELALHALLLLALLVALFPRVFLAGEVPIPGDILYRIPPWSHYAPADWERPGNPLLSDILTAFLPWYEEHLRAVRLDEWPLWNPTQMAGMPLLANCQSAAFYPPRLVHVLLGLRWGTAAYILLKLWLAGFTAYVCGRGLALNRPAATFLSIGWMLGSWNVLWATWPLPDVAVWLPILVLGAEWLVQRRLRRGFFAMALAGTLMLLAGHPETAFSAALGTGLFFLVRLAFAWRGGTRPWPALGAAAGAWGLALAVSAAQLAPFVEYLLHSATLFDRVAEKPNNWMPQAALAGFWTPRFFGSEADHNFWGPVNTNIHGMHYAGLAVWAAMLLLPALRKRPEDRARAWALLGAALCCGLMAFHVWPVSLLRGLPPFNSMLTVWHMAFPVFAMPLLGALGLHNALEQGFRVRDLRWAAGVFLLTGLGVAWLYGFYGGIIRQLDVTDYLHRHLAHAALLALASLCVLAAAAMLRRPRTAAVAMPALLALDLLLTNGGYNPTMPPERVFPETELTATLRTISPPGRAGVGEANVPSGLMSVYDIHEWLAYDGLYPARMWRFQKRLGPAYWNAMERASGVSHYLHDPRYDPLSPLGDPGRFERVATADGLEVWRNTRVLPRARLVPKAEVVEDAKALFAQMAAPSFDPAELVLLERAPTTPLPPPRDDPGKARITDYRTASCTVEVDARAPAVLVLSDAYYPGWTATIDGEPAELFPAYTVFRAVIVPEGRHTVTFAYFPDTLRAGLAVSVTAMVVSGCAAGWVLLRARTRRKRTNA